MGREEVDLERVLAVDEFTEPARALMDPKAFAYFSGGAGYELTLADNIAAFGRRRLRPRVLSAAHSCALYRVIASKSRARNRARRNFIA